MGLDQYAVLAQTAGCGLKDGRPSSCCVTTARQLDAAGPFLRFDSARDAGCLHTIGLRAGAAGDLRSRLRRALKSVFGGRKPM